MKEAHLDALRAVEQRLERLIELEKAPRVARLLDNGKCTVAEAVEACRIDTAAEAELRLELTNLRRAMAELARA